MNWLGAALRIGTSLVIFTVAAFTHVGAHAAASPPGAYNKTIGISFAVSGVSIFPDGQSKAYNTLVSQTIYVSSTGRVFFRQLATSLRGKRSRQVEAAPDAKSSASFRFQGNTLVGQLGFASGARQVTATFDPSFSSCSVSVIEGKNNNNLIKRRGPSGALHTVASSTISNPSCTIQNGNSFAGQ